MPLTCRAAALASRRAFPDRSALTPSIETRPSAGCRCAAVEDVLFAVIR
jgi:hypothetical protein